MFAFSVKRISDWVVRTGRSNLQEIDWISGNWSRNEFSIDVGAGLLAKKIMINVIASISINEGCLAEFVEVFKANVPAVLEEVGCIEYVPTVDFESGISSQSVDGAVVTVIEKWNSLEDLKAHLEAPHMLVFRERVKGLVGGVSLKILEAA